MWHTYRGSLMTWLQCSVDPDHGEIACYVEIVEISLMVTLYPRQWTHRLTL